MSVFYLRPSFRYSVFLSLLSMELLNSVFLDSRDSNREKIRTA